jgi:hypothetical protein
MAFLEASWQEEPNNVYCAEDRDNCLFLLKRYLAEHPSAAVTDPNEEADPNEVEERRRRWHTAQILVGELLRLRGRHEESASHFGTLVGSDQFLSDKYGDLIAFELKLCQNKDSDPRWCDEEERRKRREKLSREKDVPRETHVP